MLNDSLAGPLPHLPPPRAASAASLPIAAARTGAAAAKPPAAAPPRHWSIFYEGVGIEALPPPAVHYLHLGCWCTDSCDFYSHRRPRKGESPGQSVVWLHAAYPRDRFVFLITPVDEPGRHNLRALLWSVIYGRPPPFSASGAGLNLFEAIESRRGGAEGRKRRKRAVGVEALEVLHKDLTAMDYAPGLTSSRLALETRVATSKWFVSLEAACAHYKCDVVPLQAAAAAANATPLATPVSVGLSGPNTPAVLQPGAGGSSLSQHVPPPFALADGEISGRSSTTTSPFLGPSAPPTAPPPPPTTALRRCSRSAVVPSAAVKKRRHDDDLDLFQLPQAASASVGQQLTHSATLSPDEQRQIAAAAAASDGSGARCITPFAEMLPTASSRGATPLDATPLTPPMMGGGGGSVDAPHPPPIITSYQNTMVILYTQDPHFNAVLRELLVPEQGTHPYAANLREQRRLLSLYETGMPSWPIFFSRYGLPYRRWFRLVAVGLINIWPIIALCVGFYDLYKHMPYLRDWMADTLTPFTTWIETHFTLRISMLVTYLFTVSFGLLASLHSFVKSIVAIFSFVLSPIYPILQFLAVLRYPVFFVWDFVIAPLLSAGLGGINGLLMMLITPVRLVFGSLRSLLGASQSVTQGVQSASFAMVWWRSWLDFWDKVARPVKNLAKACYDGIVHVGVAITRREASLRRWYTAKVYSCTRAIRLAIRTAFDVAWYNCWAAAQLMSMTSVLQLLVTCLIVAALMYIRHSTPLELVEGACNALLWVSGDHDLIADRCDALILDHFGDELRLRDGSGSSSWWQ